MACEYCYPEIQFLLNEIKRLKRIEEAYRETLDEEIKRLQTEVAYEEGCG